MRGLLPLCAALLAVAPVSWSAAPDLPVIGDNLIENGSFEDGPVGPVPAGEVPPGWAAEAYGGNGQLAIVEGGAPGQGDRCVQMTSAHDDSTGLHGPLIEIDATTAYIQFGWARIDPGPERSGLMLGRQWFETETEALEQESSRSYNYVASNLGVDGEWAYYEQLLLPDPTPDDGSFRADEIPANAHYLRIWALCYRWDGVGYFDGLGLYQVDYAALARTDIFARLAEADIDRVLEEIDEGLAGAREDSAVAGRARELVAELEALKRRAQGGAKRHVNEWIADQHRTPELIGELQGVRWELKIEALLQAGG